MLPSLRDVLVKDETEFWNKIWNNNPTVKQCDGCHAYVQGVPIPLTLCRGKMLCRECFKKWREDSRR